MLPEPSDLSYLGMTKTMSNLSIIFVIPTQEESAAATKLFNLWMTKK